MLAGQLPRLTLAGPRCTPQKRIQKVAGSAGQQGQRMERVMIQKSYHELDLPPLNVLVAEDGLANRVLARGLLLREGHNVTLVEDGSQALSRLLGGRYDLVLMDVDMPVMDGLSATRAIRACEASTGRRTPVVALTSNKNPEECLAAGMDAFLSKPLNLATFRHVVSQVLRQRAA